MHTGKPLQAKTLAEYLRALEAQKPNPATIIEKDKVFIGAPTAATLEARFRIAPGSGAKFKYIKNDGASPEIKGIELSSGKNFFTNTGEVVCDGDLFIRGTLFLNHATHCHQNRLPHLRYGSHFCAKCNYLQKPGRFGG